MIDRRVEDWCVQAMTVQEYKPRGGGSGGGGSSSGSDGQSSNDILSPQQETLENEKESANYRDVCQPQDSENLLGRVLAGKI